GRARALGHGARHRCRGRGRGPPLHEGVVDRSRYGEGASAGRAPAAQGKGGDPAPEASDEGWKHPRRQTRESLRERTTRSKSESSSMASVTFWTAYMTVEWSRSAKKRPISGKEWVVSSLIRYI